jgi:hypothetical protein
MMDLLDDIHHAIKPLPRTTPHGGLDSIEAATSSSIGRDLGRIGWQPYGDPVESRCRMDFAKQKSIPDERSEVIRKKPSSLVAVRNHVDGQRIVEEAPRKSFARRLDLLFDESNYAVHWSARASSGPVLNARGLFIGLT